MKCYKKLGIKCNCVSCSEDAYEAANREAQRRNVIDAEEQYGLPVY